MAEVVQIAPARIVRNPENPRIHFPENELNDLAQSIHQVGVLVPVSVYPVENSNPTDYVLVDGERRWTCATRLGLDSIPAIVLPEPATSKDNILTMFHIHMVREAWQDMPTAWALGKVAADSGINDPAELSRLTGLSVERVKRLLFALSLPETYQKLIDTQDVPLNFFYELERNVISTLSRYRPVIFAELGATAIMESFVDKKRAGIITDTVELRNVRPIIQIAASEAGGVEKPCDLDVAIVELITDKTKTIQETYEDTVEIVVETDKFAKQCDQLVRKYDRLVSKTSDTAELDAINTKVSELIGLLTTRIGG